MTPPSTTISVPGIKPPAPPAGSDVAPISSYNSPKCLKGAWPHNRSHPRRCKGFSTPSRRGKYASAIHAGHSSVFTHAGDFSELLCAATCRENTCIHATRATYHRIDLRLIIGPASPYTTDLERLITSSSKPEGTALVAACIARVSLLNAVYKSARTVQVVTLSG
jgi:hypothetical protein